MESRLVAGTAIVRRNRSGITLRWKLRSMSWFLVLNTVARCGESVSFRSEGIERDNMVTKGGGQDQDGIRWY